MANRDSDTLTSVSIGTIAALDATGGVARGDIMQRQWTDIKDSTSVRAEATAEPETAITQGGIAPTTVLQRSR